MITVRQYAPTDAKIFHDLNIAWIEKYFEIEEEDLALLRDPEASIIHRGGHIFIAELDGESVGTVALIPTEEDTTVELAKMAVREDLRGRGIGKALMNTAINRARSMSAERIWLETNTTLKTAIAMYRSFHFRELDEAERQATPYCRCNCQMLLEL